MKLQINIHEDNADPERLDQLTLALIRQLRDLDIESIERTSHKQAVQGAKGDPLTVGAMILGIAVAATPSLISFLQKWVGDNRKVLLEAPNGAKIEFTADKRFSKDELMQLMRELSNISTNGQ